MVLVLCTSYDNIYICTKFHTVIQFSSYRVDMIFILEITKGHNFLKNCK